MPSFLLPPLPRLAWRAVTALAAAALLVLLAPAPAFAQADRITEFHIDAELHDDGSLSMSEAITYDFGTEPSAGLLWEYPLKVREGFLRHRAIELTDIEVDSPSGAPAEIEGRTESHGWLSLEIGDEDDPVVGAHTYVVSYTVHGAMTAEEDHDELYWDFIGTGWNVAIHDAQVHLSAPGVVEVECFTGEEGETHDCDSADRSESGVRLTEELMGEGHALTAMVHLEPGAVEVAEADWVLPSPPRWLTWSGVGSLLGALVLIGALGWLGAQVSQRREKRDKRRLPAGVPDALSSAAAGLLHAKNTLKTEHLLAMLVSLEERGVITSHPHPEAAGGWVFHLPGPPAAGVSAAEQRLLGALFAGTDTADFKALARQLSRADAKAIKRGLTAEKRRARLAHPIWLQAPAGVLAFALVVGVLIAPVAVEDVTGYSPGGLEVVALLLAGAAIAVSVGVLLPLGTTRLGRHVKRELAKARRRPKHLSPALAVALDLKGKTLDAVPELVPHHYYRDTEYRRSWDHRLRTTLRSAQSSGGSGSGGSAGGGGGGSGGGRR